LKLLNLFRRDRVDSKPAESIRKPLNQRRGLLPRQRRFDAGIVDDLTYSFVGSNTTINEEIRHSLRKMRGRSRELCQNNDYAKRFLQMVQSNVIGVAGIKLQARTTRTDGALDRADNALIERAWQIWGRPENCSVSKKLSWHDIESLAIKSVARDGEVLIELVTMPREGFGLALNILPAEYLDENNNQELPSGNRIVMGIEYDRRGVVVAYHLREAPIRAWINVYPERSYRRVDAADIIHLHIVDFPEQARGIPWTHSAIRRLNMIGKYEEAELVAAAIGASKMGFYKSPDGDSVTPDDIIDGGEDDDHELIQKMEPGYIEQMPEGHDFVGFDPTHPTTAFDGFMRAVLRGAASGLNVAYAGISNDLENVNFSSIRSGVLEERDFWRILQKWLQTHLHQRVYDRWLGLAILRGRLALPFKKVDSKFQQVQWQPRGWPWVDPKNDSTANVQNLAVGTETRQNILAQQGRDFDDVLAQLQYEREQAEAAGVNIENFDKLTLLESEASQNES